MKLIVIGGGAAGFFGAITAAERGHQVVILEASSGVLAKVRVSGGGRCNVTHSCFETRELVKAYPRGGKALRGPLSKFQPADTVEWFARRGVETKTEADGRMFPVTDDSATIVNCLQEAAANAGVDVRTNSKVVELGKRGGQFMVKLADDSVLSSDYVLLATGGSRGGFELAKQLGHKTVSPVPSLFTFVISDSRIADLPGVSARDVVCDLQVGSAKFTQSGPLLITHWGMSGPAVLRLSAWAARELHDAKYQAMLRVNWLPDTKPDVIREMVVQCRQEHGKKSISAWNPWSLPKRLWKSLSEAVVAEDLRWSDLPKKHANQLVSQLSACEFAVNGKGQFKDEFVTCGGIRLDDVDFRAMASKIVPKLLFAGEVLDVDGVTGGFNFQNAWTTAWVAGSCIE